MNQKIIENLEIFTIEESLDGNLTISWKLEEGEPRTLTFSNLSTQKSHLEWL